MSFTVSPPMLSARPSTPPSPTDLRQPTSEECVAAIISAEGDLDLAAERVFGTLTPAQRAANPDLPQPKARLTAIIADDPTAQRSLQGQMRVLTLLKCFSSLGKVAVVVDGTLANQAPEDLAKLYKDLLSVLSILTDDKTTTINANTTSTNLNASIDVDIVLKSLPPDVREAVKVLMLPTPTAPPLPERSSGTIPPVVVESIKPQPRREISESAPDLPNLEAYPVSDELPLSLTLGDEDSDDLPFIVQPLVGPSPSRQPANAAQPAPAKGDSDG